MKDHHLLRFKIDYKPERKLTEREHAEHVIGTFRLWLQNARPFMSEALIDDCEKAIEIGTDGFKYTDQYYFVDLIASACREYHEHRERTKDSP